MYIGKPFSWTPAAFEGASGICNIKRLARVSGRVVYINEAHRYFTAEADINGKKLKESFKFQQKSGL